MESSKQENDNRSMFKLVLFFSAISLFLYTVEGARLRDALHKRQDLLLIRGKGLTTIGQYSTDQHTRPNEYGRKVLVGDARIEFSVNGETHTTTLDVESSFDDPYYVRYLPDDLNATYCWKGDDSLGSIDRSILDYTCRLVLISVVFCAPGLCGLFFLFCIFLNAYQARQ